MFSLSATIIIVVILAAMLGIGMALAILLLDRRKDKETTGYVCPNCGFPVKPRYLMCPMCGEAIDIEEEDK